MSDNADVNWVVKEVRRRYRESKKMKLMEILTRNRIQISESEVLVAQSVSCDEDEVHIDNESADQSNRSSNAGDLRFKRDSETGFDNEQSECENYPLHAPDVKRRRLMQVLENNRRQISTVGVMFFGETEVAVPRNEPNFLNVGLNVSNDFERRLHETDEVSVMTAHSNLQGSASAIDVLDDTEVVLECEQESVTRVIEDCDNTRASSELAQASENEGNLTGLMKEDIQRVIDDYQARLLITRRQESRTYERSKEFLNVNAARQGRDELDRNCSQLNAVAEIVDEPADSRIELFSEDVQRVVAEYQATFRKNCLITDGARNNPSTSKVIADQEGDPVQSVISEHQRVRSITSIPSSNRKCARLRRIRKNLPISLQGSSGGSISINTVDFFFQTYPIVDVDFIGVRDVICQYCAAIKWEGETPNMCCYGGKVHVDDVPQPPGILNLLWRENSDRGVVFRKYARQLNNALSMASIKVGEGPTDCTGKYQPTVIIRGKAYSFIGALHPEPRHKPMFLQLYVHDPHNDEENSRLRLEFLKLPASISAFEQSILQSLLLELQVELRLCNPYLQDFRHIVELEDTALFNASVVINPEAKPTDEHRRLHNRNLHEVAVLVDENANSKDLVVNLRGGGLMEVKDTHRSYNALHFILLLPYGTDGWTVNDKQRNTDRRLTLQQHYCFILNERRSNFSGYLFRAERLFQEFVCIGFARIEGQRLRFARYNQDVLRAELYSNLADAVNQSDSDRGKVGQRIICPKSIFGSFRNLHHRYQEAMAICRFFHKPDYFITFTCNPLWKEIQMNLTDCQVAASRPDIIVRVFRQKVRSLMDDLKYKKIFGKVVAFLSVIEYQKRGLPHAHILVMVEDRSRLRCSEDIDRVISANIPPLPAETLPLENVEQAKKLRSTVLKCMIHGPCGSLNPNSPCMLDGKCSKGYPKQFIDETLWLDDSSYPLYKRASPSAGGAVETLGIYEVDNRWVVPYNPFLSAKYDAHINVEACVSVRSPKYLFKYLLKGYDKNMAKVNFDDVVDEIEIYQNLRCIGALEACARIFSIPQSDRFPAVQSLPVHLPDQNYVLFAEGMEQEALQDERNKKTPLTEFFEFNSRNCSTQVKYSDFPYYFTWQPNRRVWVPRKKLGSTIGRVVTVHPCSGDRFYLRMLLHHEFCQGKVSFADLLTLSGEQKETYKDVCYHLGLLEDDREWESLLQEANNLLSSLSLRRLFCVLLIYCEVSDPKNLFEKNVEHWSDDFRRQFPSMTEEMLRIIVLLDMETILKTQNKDLKHFALACPTDEEREELRKIGVEKKHALFEDELNYDRSVLENITAARFGEEGLSLNKNQKEVCSHVLEKIKLREQCCVFLDARGGTGKTFTLNTLLNAARISNETGITPALAVASSGIAATLLTGGRTAHSRFRIPLVVDEFSHFSIPVQSELAKLINECCVIVWDEAPMVHRFIFEAFDRSLRDITNTDRIFGGKSVVFAGDFRQILPVIKSSNRATVAASTIKSSYLWNYFTVFSLSENMRLRSASEEAICYDEWLLQVGNGTNIDSDGYVTLNPDRVERFCNRSLNQAFANAIRWTFGSNFEYIARSRAILTVRNLTASEINEMCCKMSKGSSVECYSADSCCELEDQCRFTVEFLNSIHDSSVPDHKLTLKPGVPIMLIRNLDPRKGLCNGARLFVVQVISKRLIIARRENCEELFYIPRINLIVDETEKLPLKWRRRQFPVKLAFAMTINKCQGQTLERAAVFLSDKVFSHGQLYVAASRVSDPSSIRFYVNSNDSKCANVVYKEVLL